MSTFNLGDRVTVTSELLKMKTDHAITSQEQAFGRAAPPPAEPTGRGGNRLSARFAEWMMGLPDGWITEVPGITRTEALRLAGNGVVPQQAVAALTNLLAMEAVA